MVAMGGRGAVTTLELAPEQAGLARHKLADIVGGDVAHNAAALKTLLDGNAGGAYRDIVVLNTAAALMVAGAVSDIKAGAARAAEVLASGAARAKLNQLIEASQSS